MKKHGMILGLFLMVLVPFSASAWTTFELNEIFKDGDLIFHESTSAQAPAIKEATGSNLTHVGVVFKKSSKWYVAEAVGPVKTTLLTDFIKRGKHRDFIVRRLKQGLTKTQLQKLKTAMEKWLGKKYDIYFEWSNKTLYCSEFTYKGFRDALGIEVGEVETWGDLNTSGPEVQKLIKKRLTDQGKPFNENEKIITPISHFNSNLLMTVYDSSVGF